MEDFQDIPKLYTALAEWGSCVSAVWLCRRFYRKEKLPLLIVSLLLLCMIQLYCGMVSNILWLLGMATALLVMFFTIYWICGVGWKEAAYLCLRGFMAAEFIAALEWQIDFFFDIQAKTGSIFSWFLCLSIYFLFYVCYCFIEYRTLPGFVHGAFQPVTQVQLGVTAGLVLFFFAFSNLSYLHLDLPFTDHAARGIFNSRTLIDLAGVLALFGFNLSRMEGISVRENLALRETVERQYQQYMAAQEARDIINHKYHDMKHHLAVLRRNSEDAEELLGAIEKELDAYKPEFDTGCQVLDTVLTEKDKLCREKGITFAAIADGSLLNDIPVIDLCTIFGNALDNAIEYEEKVSTPEKRRIALTVHRWNSFVLIQIDNYYEGTCSVNGTLPMTTKKDRAYHGFGLSSIKRTTEKYGGVMTIETEERLFRLKLLIPASI